MGMDLRDQKVHFFLRIGLSPDAIWFFSS
jgi:hypothetical protein